VLVAKDDVPQALGAMRDEALPRPKTPGVLDAVGKGSLVPSQAAEHAQYVTGLAGDLERTLTAIDGVLTARVHLNAPEADPFVRDATRPRPSASVLIEHRGPTPPISADEVAHLVSGAVAGLFPADVHVILVPRPAPAQPSGDASQSLGHVGPIAVARKSMRALQGALVVLVGLVAMLAALTLFLYTRLARLRAERKPHTAMGLSSPPPRP
jgi:type III secretion protein J